VVLVVGVVVAEPSATVVDGAVLATVVDVLSGVVVVAVVVDDSDDGVVVDVLSGTVAVVEELSAGMVELGAVELGAVELGAVVVGAVVDGSVDGGTVVVDSSHGSLDGGVVATVVVVDVVVESQGSAAVTAARPGAAATVSTGPAAETCHPATGASAVNTTIASKRLTAGPPLSPRAWRHQRRRPAFRGPACRCR
jgi:hypothetical protein